MCISNGDSACTELQTACYSGFVQDRFESLISFYREVIVLVLQIKKNTFMKLNQLVLLINHN